MTTTPSAVLAASWALVQAAFPAARVVRNTAKPTRMEPGGLVVMRDGDPGEAEVTLSPQAWTFAHRIGLEIAPFASDDPRAALTAMLAPLGAMVQADRFLSGLADWIEIEPPQTDETDTLGAPVLNWAEVGLVVTYTTSNPLG